MKERVLYSIILASCGTVVFGAAGVAAAIGILPSEFTYPAMLTAGGCVLALIIAIVAYANHHPTPPPKRYRNDMFANTYKWRVE